MYLAIIGGGSAIATSRNVRLPRRLHALQQFRFWIIELKIQPLADHASQHNHIPQSWKNIWRIMMQMTIGKLTSVTRLD